MEKESINYLLTKIIFMMHINVLIQGFSLLVTFVNDHYIEPVLLTALYRERTRSATKRKLEQRHSGM